MKFRKLTMEESFPFAYKKGLQKIQSEHFVNSAIASGAIEKGYENFPMEVRTENNLPLQIEANPPQFLIGTYIKNHWRVILASLVLGGLIWYGIDNQTKRKKQKAKLKIN
ncbi:MAG: hypothetical protein RLZZ323_1447 [Bacteroidota bacterium]|jgi:hypothetical protein